MIGDLNPNNFFEQVSINDVLTESKLGAFYGLGDLSVSAAACEHLADLSIFLTRLGSTAYYDSP
jgi:hypothetical protein